MAVQEPGCSAAGEVRRTTGCLTDAIAPARQRPDGDDCGRFEVVGTVALWAAELVPGAVHERRADRDRREHHRDVDRTARQRLDDLAHPANASASTDDAERNIGTEARAAVQIVAGGASQDGREVLRARTHTT